MTSILVALNLVGIVVNAWVLIRLLKAKKIMEGYCETALDASKIALSVQNETTNLNNKARAMFEEAKKRLEEANDATQTAGKA